ncbi:SIMPL domain-containing protein [Brevundimonas sp.]|uniref:SIMPL domain-containing protein n=1 Tax=Brevundimonas sp. TaxID=1871086 RepID=UPI00391D9702
MTRYLFLALGVAAIAGPALAQTPPATIGERYVPAPWWMRDPVIASVGHVRVEVPTNRAAFSATFQVVDRTAAEGSRRAADQVRALSQTLAGFGEDAVRVETTLTTRPLYDQYRDADGNLRDNVRADRIDRYQVDAVISVTVQDTAVLERAYGIVVAAQPTNIGHVSFSLQPDNETVTWLANEAVRDAAARARVAAEAAGSRLGPARVIDPSGRACQTDVLAGWPSYGAAPLPTTVDDVVVTGAHVAAAPPPPPPAAPGGGADQADAAGLALQPPLRWLSSQACVVYGLN